MDMALALPGYDVGNLTARRSYAARFITQQVNKLINLPVLKDHRSAGVTLALKNMSHCLVNNVCRSHNTITANACGFLYSRCRRHAGHSQQGRTAHSRRYQRSLSRRTGARPQFVWEHQTMYFATDPVALDHIGWKAIDEKRLAVGMKRIADDKPDRFSTYLNRQPEHIGLAGALGLGEWDEKKIDLRRIQLS
jgi:hypothetical protein